MPCTETIDIILLDKKCGCSIVNLQIKIDCGIAIIDFMWM